MLAVITHFGFRHFRFTVSEAIAEPIQHAARKVAVRAVFHRVIRKRGQLVGVVIKRHGQLAAEGILAEQKLRNRLAAACTRIPALHYGGEAFLRKAQIHGAAGHIDENDGLAVFATISISFLCGAGSSKFALSPEPTELLWSISSPSRFSLRPVTSTTTSLCSATVSASERRSPGRPNPSTRSL